MHHLSDMEDLIQKIPNSAIADYMDEALRCYGAKAYRGCIVMSYIALFDDLVRKLSEIRHVNKKAREIHDEVIRRQNTQDVYENYLLEQLSSNKIISGLDASTASVIKNRRNKSAHASGHIPSAEEARFVFFEVIDKFLSKHAFSSKVLADEILSRLENKNFFPSNMVYDIKAIISHEIKLLNADAYPYLISKLIDNIKSFTNINLSQNSRYFLIGLSVLNQKEWNKLIVSKLLEKKLDDEAYMSQCISVISANPELIENLTTSSLNRLKKYISKNTQETPNSSSINSPANLFENILNKAPQLLSLLAKQVEEFLSKHSYLSISPKLAKAEEKIWESYQIMLLSKAGSSNFDTANNFARQFNIIKSEVNKNSEADFLLKLVIAIIKASEWGAWGAVSVVSVKFGGFQEIKSSIEEYLINCTEEAKAILNEEFSEEYTPESFRKKFFETESA